MLWKNLIFSCLKCLFYIEKWNFAHCWRGELIVSYFNVSVQLLKSNCSKCFCLISSKLTSYLVTKVSFKISNHDYLGIKMRIYKEKESCEYKFSDQTTNKLKSLISLAVQLIILCNKVDWTTLACSMLNIQLKSDLFGLVIYKINLLQYQFIIFKWNLICNTHETWRA